jgi:hypothetical protein
MEHTMMNGAKAVVLENFKKRWHIFNAQQIQKTQQLTFDTVMRYEGDDGAILLSDPSASSVIYARLCSA